MAKKVTNKAADETLAEMNVTFAHGHDGLGYKAVCHKTGTVGRAPFSEGLEAAKLDLIAQLSKSKSNS